MYKGQKLDRASTKNKGVDLKDDAKLKLMIRSGGGK
jgi:hypothetical protein